MTLESDSNYDNSFDDEKEYSTENNRKAYASYWGEPFPETRSSSLAIDNLIKEEKIWKDKSQKPESKIGIKIIEKATEKILSLHRFLTLEETREILYYDRKKGVYCANGEIIIEKELEKLYGFDLRTSDITEIKNHIIRKTFVKRSKFDNDINIINLKNGLYNIETNKINPHTADYYSINQKQIIYDPKARPRLFIKFLNDIIEPEDLRTVIEIMAYTFWRSNPIEHYFTFLGNGGNGKSVLVGVILGLHGVQNVSNVSIQSLIKNRFALADLENKDVNIDNELSSFSIKDLSILKKLTGNQPQRIERKNQHAYDTLMHAKLIFNANTLPFNPDNSDARFRREIIVFFPNHFEGNKEDTKLLSRLLTEEEKSGIFNILMIALKNILKKQKIYIKEKTSSQRRERHEMIYDPITSFIAKATYKVASEEKNDYVTKESMYTIYTHFCKFHKLPVMTKKAFDQELKRKHGFTDDRETRGNNRKMIWKEVRLVDWINMDSKQEKLDLV